MKKATELTIGLLVVSSFLTHTLFAQTQSISQEIIAYIHSVEGKKVGRGECWDLLAYALDATDAQWSRTENFGRKLNYPEEKLKAGDMIRLLNVSYHWGGSTSRHYAIVYEVLEGSKLRIADQNVGGIRKVRIREYDLAEIKKGEVSFYRPQKKRQ
jgi:hypothetical protein